MALIQSNQDSSQTGSTVTLKFTSAQNAGDLNCVVIGTVAGAITVSSVSDSSNGTYTKAIGPIVEGSNDVTGWIYYFPNIAAAAANANTVSITFGSSVANPEIILLEYSGLAITSPVNVTTSNSGASGTSTVSVTTTNANDTIVVGWLNNGNGWNGTPGSGFTNVSFDAGSGCQCDSKIVTSTGTYTDTPTNLGGSWLGIAAAFRATGSSGGPAPGTVTFTGSGTARVAEEGKGVGSIVFSGSSTARTVTSGSLSTFLKGKLADYAFGGVSFTPASTLYLCAYTVSPGPNDTGTEVSGSGYARVAVTNNLTTGFFSFATSVKQMRSQSWAMATGAWGNVVSLGLRDANSSGNLYAYSDLFNSFNVQNGVTLTFSSTDVGWIWS